jgi:hypothetical protein
MQNALCSGQWQYAMDTDVNRKTAKKVFPSVNCKQPIAIAFAEMIKIN